MIELKWTIAGATEPGFWIEGVKVKLQYRKIPDVGLQSPPWINTDMSDFKQQETPPKTNPPQNEIYVHPKYYGAPYDD